MEWIQVILNETGLDGWRAALFVFTMWWSKVLGKMMMVWWEEVKVARWKKELEKK